MAAPVLFSTRELARMCGVSESTIKRWADDGLLACVKTPGGHRKFTLEALTTFAAEHRFELDSLGDLSDRERVAVGVEQLLRARSIEPLRDALLRALRTGDRTTALHLLRRALDADYALVVLIDDLITPVMAEIGRLWADGTLTIEEEHRATQIVLDAVGEMGGRHGAPAVEAPIVLGACGPGERHVLALKLMLALLHSAGWRPIDLGADTPLEGLARMAEREHPTLVLVSVTQLADPSQFVREFNAVAQRLKPLGIPIALGGHALTASLRQRCKATWCPANAAQLLEIVGSLPSTVAGSGA